MRAVKQVEQIVPPVVVKKHGHAQGDGFASETAKTIGVTKQSLNQHIARAAGYKLDRLPKIAET